MKIVSMTCPSCGAILQVDAENKYTTCSFCGNALFIDDEANHVIIDDPEQVGYQFEKGRQRAQTEQYYSQPSIYAQPSNYTQPKKRRTWLWVLGWLFAFPIPLTIIVLRNQKLSKNVKIGIIAVAWILYLIIGFSGRNSNKNETTREIPSIESTSETQSITAKESIEVVAVTIESETSELILGERISLKVTVLPENAEDKSITWESSDDSVVTFDEKGNLVAVGDGTAIITAKAASGASSSQKWTVDGSKRLMSLRVWNDRQDNNNIGDEWSSEYTINGEKPSREYIVSVGDSLNCWMKITESDDNPDVGQATKTHIVSESDFENGFTIEMDVYVTENGGRNSGKSAHFIATYEFSAN